MLGLQKQIFKHVSFGSRTVNPFCKAIIKNIHDELRTYSSFEADKKHMSFNKKLEWKNIFLFKFFKICSPKKLFSLMFGTLFCFWEKYFLVRKFFILTFLLTKFFFKLLFFEKNFFSSDKYDSVVIDAYQEPFL